MNIPASQPGWAPAIPDFDGSQIHTFPRVFLSAREINLARERLRNQKWASAILERLTREADEALQFELQPLDESWWRTAQTQPWEQTYPAVFEHTQRQPMRYAHAASVCALVWSLTGHTQYADRACDLLLLLAHYSFEPQHFDVGMNFTTWGTEFLQAYDLVGQRFAPAERQRLDACLTRLARAVLRNDVYWIENNIGGGLNNHLAWHKMMLGLLGLFYGRPELVSFCIEGPRGMLPLLGEGLLDNGLWCESSLIYHFTAIVPMIRFADAQKRMGQRPTLLDLEAANGRTLKQPFDAMFDVLFPDGLIPPVGDAYAYRARLWDSPVYEYAWAAWRDPHHAWLLGQCKARSQHTLFAPDLPDRVAPPSIRSILLPEHGYVFLRDIADNEPLASARATTRSVEAGAATGSYWNSNARCVFLTYDRSGVHSNADKLSIMLFGEGRLLLADREAHASVPHAFSSQVQRELNRGTICHNTVMIDGQDQRGTSQLLRLLEFHVTPTEQRATVADTQSLLYAGVRQARTVILAPEYVLDVFQVDCGASPRQIDWLAHPLDETASLQEDLNPSAQQAHPMQFPAGLPWSWLRDVRQMTAPMPLNLTWTTGAFNLRLGLQASADASLILCGFPATDEPASPTRPMIILRQKAKSTIVAAIWTIGEKPLTATLLRMTAPGLRYRVQWDGGSREHIIPPLATAVSD